MDIKCPNGCDPEELRYVQKEVTLSAYQVTMGDGRDLLVDFMTHLADYADYYKTDEEQMFLSCAGCLMMRAVKVGQNDRIIEISSELLPDP